MQQQTKKNKKQKKQKKTKTKKLRFFGFWFFGFVVLSQAMYNLMMATTMAETCSC